MDLLLDDVDPDNSHLHPRARYALYKFLWAAGHRGYALEKMVEFSRILSGEADFGTAHTLHTLDSSGGTWEAGGGGNTTGKELLSKVFVLIGEWQLAVNEDDLERPMMEEVLKYLQVGDKVLLTATTTTTSTALATTITTTPPLLTLLLPSSSHALPVNLCICVSS